MKSVLSVHPFSDASNTRQTETNGYTSNPSGKRIYLPNLHSKLIKFLIEFPDRRRHLEDDIAGKGFGIVWTQTEEGI